MCSRIWCVRPVSSRQATSVARSPNRSRISTCVTARRPPTGRSISFTSVGKRARHHRQVRPLQIVIAKAVRQLAVRVRRLREHDQPAGLEIDPVDDEHRPGAGPPRRADRPGCCGRSPASARSAGRTACRRRTMSSSSNTTANTGSWRSSSPRAARPVFGVARASAPPMTATTTSPAYIGLAGDLDPPAVDEHAADVQQDARLPPRQARHPRRQHLIQAPPHVGVADGEGDAVRGGHGRAR